MQEIPLIGIVDDDPDIPAALASLIRSLGYGAVCFSSAEALLSSKDVDRFRCVISDVHMPTLSGLDLIALLKKRRPDLPVILMTGRFEQGLADRAALAGAAILVTKPFGLKDLMETISRSVRG
ncbi:response regulator [Rhizobium bangladeshense]|uniref:response regulator n=1 Tax=Rhizobium bangladeshense TaxID=1138189 RepID=UPI001C83913A|nr:response regulator [Rhizobium bangladeshense]MBX4871061.1 response regulator [Rhizobium bangladeshense]MBX4871361.1 response regulator [Rhizobium bangladeshense]MBX4887625.1 response regulator [Rhizobium bangladeshense]